MALAARGDSRAESLIERASKSRPDDIAMKFNYIPRVRAALALRHGDPNKALQLMEPARAYDQGDSGSLYFRGIIFLKLGRYGDAISQFQRVLDMGDVEPEDPLLILARLGAARATAGSGDKAKARQMYQDVLAVWKDADPDVPLIREAKAEYAKLQ
jgi:tetratricopeptide (TPR) repeat protein